MRIQCLWKFVQCVVHVLQYQRLDGNKCIQVDQPLYVNPRNDMYNDNNYFRTQSHKYAIQTKATSLPMC